MRTFSLTTRLTVLYTLVSAMLLLGMAALMSKAIDQHFEDLDRDTLNDKISLVQHTIAQAHNVQDLQAQLTNALQHHPGLFVRVSGSNPLYTSPNFKFPDLPTGTLGQLHTWQAEHTEYRALTATAPADATLGNQLHIQVALDTVHHAHFIHSLQTALRIYVVLAALLSGVLGWWAARTGLAPLRAMKKQAQAVTAHKLNERMPADTVPVEMADLAHSLNDMLARLQRDFERLSQFSSDLAHELRTPISNLLTQTQVALGQPRQAQAYQDILASNAEELQRLARTVSDMLLLAKAEHGLLLPQTETINLADEAQALLDFYEALAEENGIRLVLTGQATVQGDRLMLRRAISNLLSNALRYGMADQAITIEIEQQAAQAVLHVTNHGPDIAPEFLPRLFDRFFRADPARAQPETDGAGLGLAITQAIMRAHGGQATATSGNGVTRFSLWFPLSRPPA